MISVSSDFDLGADKTRMNDVADVTRQQRTVEELLARLYAGPARKSKSVQLLADEVGMGKTFVALAVAYSLLAALQAGDAHDDLRACAQKVLVIAPSRTLANKWKTEVSEFVKRCMSEEKRQSSKADHWFRASDCDHIDDLALAMRQTGHRVLITTTGTFGRKLLDQDTKKRFALAALCRFWGNAFRYDARDFMLKGAPDGWPKRASALEQFSDQECEGLVCPDIRTAVEAVAWVAREHASLVDQCHERCRDLGTPFRHNRADDFAVLGDHLLDVYRWMAAWSCRPRTRFP